MAFLVAAFGRIEPSDWSGLVDAVAEGNGPPLSAWQDDESAVRIANFGTNGALGSDVRWVSDRAAALVGYVDGQADGAVAALDAYGRAGAVGLARLRGEYAYALWDGRERSLFVGCDAVGLRGPSYAWNGRTFIASTRAIALLRHPAVPRVFDPVYLAHAMSGLWSRPASATAFQGVRRMVGGELIRVSVQGLERLTGARLAFRASAVRSPKRAVEDLADVLDGAASRRAQPGPSCVALSGGVDSCVVATALVKHSSALEAFSLVSPNGSPGDGPALASLLVAFPGVRHHPVLLTGDAVDLLDHRTLPDDPICAGPVLQPGRAGLLRAIRDAGFRRVFDGEGGDEIFDIARRPGDLIRDRVVGRVISALVAPAHRRRLLRDFILGGHGPASRLLLERAKKRAVARRPWLQAAFWRSPFFAAAWEEAISFWRLRSARERLPEILGAHGRYWRAQELVRRSIGVEGLSPLLDQNVVELVGSIDTAIAFDLSHGKALLRRLAAQRVPPTIAWRPKNEPLSDWLIDRWIAQDANVGRLIGRVKSSKTLADVVDTAIVMASVNQARRQRAPDWLASSLVELGALVEWVTAVETRCGL